MGFKSFILVALFTSAFATPSDPYKHCKPIPGDRGWPSLKEWKSLNASLSGRLITPPLPGGVCYVGQPNYDPAKCPALQTAWTTNVFHTQDPISNLMNNWNNDTCIPLEGAPCSRKGYPIYTINATSAQDVKKGIDFARKTGVRLIVKGTGHDYLGRSQAPNSLSIWTLNIKGIQYHEKGTFKQACKKTRVNNHAFTVAIGTPMNDINLAARAKNLTITSGGAATVGLGGFLSGGGHSAMSPIWGMAADNVIELEVVTPEGNIVTANECENADLFWAIRGGGASTFGVMTKATIRAFPSFKYATVSILLGTPGGVGVDATPFWTAMAKFISYFPSLAREGISHYGNLDANVPVEALGLPPGTIPFPYVSGFRAVFNLPLIHPENTTEGLTARVNAIIEEAKVAGGSTLGVPWLAQLTPIEWPDFYANFDVTNGPRNGGDNALVASRLLTEQTLTGNATTLAAALAGIAPQTLLTTHIVSGPGVSDTSRILGGSNSINPAWRKAYMHITVSVGFPPLNPAARDAAHLMLKDRIAYLDRLEPGAGSYVNEGDPTEAGFQRLFWGDNYPRLKQLQHKFDPKDVFWCGVCVGSEEWKEVVGKDGQTRVCKM